MQLEDWSQQLGSPRAYYPKLAKVVGGTAAAIFLEYLCQQCAGSQAEWTASTVKGIERETGLSAQEQQLARKQLRDRGIVEERLAPSSSSALEFCLNWEMLERKLESFAKLVFDRNAPEPSDPVVEASGGKSDPFFGTPNGESGRGLARERNILPDYRFAGPWESSEQFEAFQKALLDYAIAQGFAYPSGWAFKIIDGLTKGLISPYWEEFLAGVPLGSTQQAKRDWEVEPGVPYPAFEEERIQYYIHKGEPLETAVARARAELRNPVVGQDLWEGFLRRCDRIADEALKAKQLGVKVPYLPPSFTEKRVATKETVAQKLAAVTSQPTLQLSPSEPSPEPLEKSSPDSETHCSIPSLAALQTLYNSPLSRAIAEQQIAEHPEWGYVITDGRVVDLYPF